MKERRWEQEVKKLAWPAALCHNRWWGFVWQLLGESDLAHECTHAHMQADRQQRTSALYTPPRRGTRDRQRCDWYRCVWLHNGCQPAWVGVHVLPALLLLRCCHNTRNKTYDSLSDYIKVCHFFLIYRSNFALKSPPDFAQFQHDCSDFHHVITKGAAWRQTGSTCKEVGAVNCRKSERAPYFWMSVCTYPGKLSRNSVFSAHPAWNVWNAYSCACFSGISSLPSLLVAWS